MFSSIIFDSLNIYIYILTTLFIMNIVFPESGMQLESNHDDEGNENFQKKNIDLMCITLFGTLFRDVH